MSIYTKCIKEIRVDEHLIYARTWTTYLTRAFGLSIYWWSWISRVYQINTAKGVTNSGEITCENWNPGEQC